MPGRTRMVVNVFSLLGAFVAGALVLGVLAAGLFIPAVGATGTVTKSGIDLFDSLPSDFTRLPLPQSSRIYDAKGGLIATPYTENRIIVKLDQIAPIMRDAQVAIEDDRFYEHGGADLRGIARAAVQNAGSDDTQGASTLTQQYVKVTLFEQAARANDEAAKEAATAQTYSRKLQELKYAVQVEKKLSKDQILENYLNLVFYGDGAYGVEAAAQHYFSTTAAKLTLPQAALLAGIVQDPSRCDPRNNPECAQTRRDIVLDRMYQLGKITADQWTASKAIPIASMLKVAPAQNNCTNSTQQYFCQYVIEWLKTQPALGETPADRLNLINTGGLIIKTTIDPTLSSFTHDTLTKTVPSTDPYVGAASTVIEPGTGKVLAMAQTSDFKVKQTNWNVPLDMGGTIGFAIGSTAKMFALVRALETGTPTSGSITAKYASPSKPAKYTSKDMTDACRSGDWSVENDFGIGGKISLRKATAQSINTAFAGLVLKLRPCTVQATMTKMHLLQGNGDEIQKYPSAITLGSDSVPPITLASSYATLAAGGIYCAPVPVASVTTLDGKALAVKAKDCAKVIEPEVAAGVTDLLRGVITGGTATNAALSGGRVAAGKTGTTDAHTESWFVGYTPQRATAVYVGTPDSQKSMDGISIGGRNYGPIFGGTLAAPMWAKIMNQANAGLPEKNFPSVSSKIKNGDLVDLPSVYGRTVSDATARLESAGFKVDLGSRINSTVRQGLVAGTDPGGKAPRGTSVTLLTSTGSAPTQPKPKATATKAPATPPAADAAASNRRGPVTPPARGGDDD